MEATTVDRRLTNYESTKRRRHSSQINADDKALAATTKSKLLTSARLTVGCRLADCCLVRSYSVKSERSDNVRVNSPPPPPSHGTINGSLPVVPRRFVPKYTPRFQTHHRVGIPELLSCAKIKVDLFRTNRLFMITIARVRPRAIQIFNITFTPS